MNCLFCEISNNKIPSYTIYEDDIVKAFLDIHPDSNGHTLIIPKKHYTDITDIDNNTLLHIMNIVRLLQVKLKEKLNIDGFALIQNNGDIQEVKHYHLHLKPYYKDKQTIINIEKIYNLLIKES